MRTLKKTTPVARAVAGARSAQARTVEKMTPGARVGACTAQARNLEKKAFLVATEATGGGAAEGPCSLSLTKTKKTRTIKNWRGEEKTTGEGKRLIDDVTGLGAGWRI
jgi:hypothetical protein